MGKPISSGIDLMEWLLCISGDVKASRYFQHDRYTQVDRMSRSRRVLAIGGKQGSFGLRIVCFETVLYHVEPL